MCGIAGFLSKNSDRAGEEVQHLLRKMGTAILHRGPDDAGEWWDVDAGIGFSHRRLSVLDLTPSGHQPMTAAGGRFVIVFNGEIYNHLCLRDWLEKEGRDISWRGHSDTETLLAGFETWGVRETVRRAVGMFAFALWDRQERVLTLGRDRVGEKPLYYGWQGKSFLFASELKALRAHPSFAGGVNRGALSLFLRHNYIPAPHSIHPNIYKLPPGSLLTVSLRRPEPEVEVFWSGIEIASEAQQRPFQGGASEVIDSLDTVLRDAIANQMVADVPIGAFLSGGVDSSAVVALMQVQSSRPVKTFSIGFNEVGYNEAKYAKAVANHLGTDHTELYVTPSEAMNVIPRLPILYDEPFSDSSQIPTFLVSELARKHVTVSLSGDAGDELFCGYNRYLLAERLWGKYKMLPPVVRSGLATALTSVAPDTWNKLLSLFFGLLPSRFSHANGGDKLHKLASVLDAKSLSELYIRLISHWSDPAINVLGKSAEPLTLLTQPSLLLDGLGDVQRMMALDLVTYLPDDNLVKVDRSAMGCSLESRVPFLDHRVVEFAWSLPLQYKLRGGVTKWALREVLYRYVPRQLIERPKMGFGVPIDSWLRGPLREWADSLIEESRLRKEGFFDSVPIRQKWAEHLSGKRNWQYHLWDVLMFQAWLDNSNCA